MTKASGMNHVFQYSKDLIFSGLFLLLFANSVLGQNSELDSLVKKFNQYSQQALQEKIYLHTDRDFYMTGEILWFKVYYVDGILHQPLNLSKVAYVEVLDSANNAILQGSIALKEGFGNGSFYLPVSITSGNYKVRAYTNWMKNFSPEFYFERPVTIVNPFNNLGLPALESSQQYDIQFFPEGGNLVEGLESKVAFKAVNSSGKGIDFKGMIVNQQQDTLIHFESLKFGMGNFSFTPTSQDQYQAIIQIDDTTFEAPLPTIYPEGYVLSVAETNGNQISVTAQAKTNDPMPFMYLLVHTRQSLKFSSLIQLTGNKGSIQIDKNILGEGISHFTLFNSQKQPVCERLYFRAPSKELQIEATTDQPFFGPREKVNINIQTQVAQGDPVPANLSVSIFQIDSLSLFNPIDIRTYFWLTSDLKGHIESPAYYLTLNTPESHKAMDNLMLTQGWRRFNWETVLSDKFSGFTYLPEHEGAIISANMVDRTTNEPAVRIPAYLSIPGKNFQFYAATSYQTGEVKFMTKNIYGNIPLLIQTDTEVDSTIYFTMVSPYSKDFTSYSNASFDFSANLKQNVLQRSRNMQVQNVFLEDTINTFLAPPADSLPFYGVPDRVFLLDDYTRFPTMEEVMREYVQGVAVRKQKGEFYYKIVNEANNMFFAEEPLILLDGMPIFDTDKAVAIDPLKIKKLDVIKQRFRLGTSVFSGIVSYTTYDNDISWFQIDRHASQVNFEGMQLQREFYTPQYETAKQIESRMPDFRTLLYWKPDVITNETGDASIAFYTSDQQGKYIGIIQGLTNQGEMGSLSFTFEVKGELTN